MDTLVVHRLDRLVPLLQAVAIALQVEPGTNSMYQQYKPKDKAKKLIVRLITCNFLI